MAVVESIVLMLMSVMCMAAGNSEKTPSPKMMLAASVGFAALAVAAGVSAGWSF